MSVFATVSELVDAHPASPPSAIVLSLDRPEDAAPLRERLLARGIDGLTTPVLCISARHDLAHRVAAAHLGATHFFAAPVDPDRLLEVIRDEVRARYRVLLVDDDVDLAVLLQAHFERAGIALWTLSDPTLALTVVEQTSPELILLDVHIPEVSGIEVAKVLRQDLAFAGVPIVFISADTTIGTQRAAMSAGGDDFIGKPVIPERLVEAVVPRLRRSRALHAAVDRAAARSRG